MRLLLTSFFLIIGFFCFGQNQKNYALTQVNLYNGYENKIYSNVMVLGKSGKIERIGKVGEPIPTGYEVIDCQNYYLMPGMIDAHSHVDNLAAAIRALETGVTTVRTAGVAAYQDVALANLTLSGKIAGPDVIAAGVYVSPQSGRNGSGRHPAGSPD